MIDAHYDELSELEAIYAPRERKVKRIMDIILRIKRMLLVKDECFLANEKGMEIRIFKNKNKIQCQAEDFEAKGSLKSFLTKMEELLSIEGLFGNKKEELLLTIEQKIIERNEISFEDFCHLLFAFEEVIIRSSK